MLLINQAVQYANDVMNGVEVTTKEVVQQCQIFLNDYNANQHQEDFSYYFDDHEIDKIEKLLSVLNFATGFVAGKQVLNNLAPFQSFLIVNIFGFRFKNNPKKFKHNDVTLFISRKNAKTAIVGIIFILLLLTEQKHSEFYSICLTRELAAEIRKSMVQIIEASPYLVKHFKISKTFTGKIECLLTRSFYQPRTSESGKNNSVRPSAICSDEHGNFQNADNFNALKGGMKNVVNPLVFRTTTAYAISNSIMEADLEYIREVLNGKVEDERQFALLYYAEESHLWDDIGLYQSNPLRIEENYNIVRDNRKKARLKPTELVEYITKDMNNFVQLAHDEPYLIIDAWRKCRVDKIDFEGAEVIVGGDFAISLDLNAVSIVGKSNGKYKLVSKGFLPIDTLEERREKIDYKSMEKQGYCELMPGRVADYNRIEAFIRGIELEYNCVIKCIALDPYNALQMANNLAKDYEVVMIKQTYCVLSPPIKAFRDSVYNLEIEYQKNDLLDYCVSNAVCVIGKTSEQILLAKENKNKQRIDMLMSSIFAYSQIYLDKDVYSMCGALESMDW